MRVEPLHGVSYRAVPGLDEPAEPARVAEVREQLDLGLPQHVPERARDRIRREAQQIDDECPVRPLRVQTIEQRRDIGICGLADNPLLYGRLERLADRRLRYRAQVFQARRPLVLERVEQLN